jgi:hypothetical protein
MKHVLRPGLLITVVALLLFALNPTPTPAATATAKLPSIIGIATGGVGTSGYQMTVAYAAIMEKWLKTTVRTLPSPSIAVNFEQIKEGKAHFIGGAVSQSAYGMAAEGITGFAAEAWGPQPVTLVWYNYGASFGILVRGDSPIKIVKDLKGKKLASYASPSMQARYEGALRFAGYTIHDAKVVTLGDYNATIAAVGEGKVDWTVAATYSTKAYEIAEGAHGIRWIPMPLEDKEGWARYFEVNGYDSSGIAVKGHKTAIGIPGMTAPHLAATISTVDSEVIYYAAKFFGDAYDQYKDAFADLPEMSIQNMKRYLTVSPFPVHPGTIMYLKEKGIWTAADDEWNKAQIDLQAIYRAAWGKAVAEAKAKGIKINDKSKEWLEVWDTHRKTLPGFRRK